jgi:hypothetical protein
MAPDKDRLWALVDTVKNILIPEFLSQLECCKFLKKPVLFRSLQAPHICSLSFFFRIICMEGIWPSTFGSFLRFHEVCDFLHITPFKPYVRVISVRG